MSRNGQRQGSVVQQPLLQKKIAFDSLVKIAFRRFLFADDTNLFFSQIDFPD